MKHLACSNNLVIGPSNILNYRSVMTHEHTQATEHSLQTIEHLSSYEEEQITCVAQITEKTAKFLLILQLASV
jgi:cytoplasmic iron level regulating protein YaaA (DUF328/UPF0246 family)